MFGKDRLEIFSDGVLAIVITIMALELKAPRHAEIADLFGLFPKLFSYVLSFLYVAIYWNSHHHMFLLVERVNGRVLWANFHLLFWLSLIPFSTSWMGETEFSRISTILYGFVLLMSSVAYQLLERIIIRTGGAGERLSRALGRDVKGKISPLLYLAGMAAGFFSSLVAVFFYVGTAILWIVPDRRIEQYSDGGEE